MVIEAFVQALQNLANPGLLLWMFGGVIVGLIFGLIPGIGSLTAIALFFPFVFRLLPEQALPFIVAVAAVGFTGGSVCAVLLNMPGQETNAATIMDGYPMTKKGEGGRALGAALMSSGLGGAAVVFISLALVPLVLPIVVAFVSADMVFIILLGLAFIAVLGSGSMIKGLISGGLGLLISFIGYQAVTLAPRFTFGSAYLYDGLGLLPLSLGLFAIPEALELAVRGGTIADTDRAIAVVDNVWEGAKDVFRHWGLWLRSTIIGYIVGIIPGIGAITATFIAYGQAKQTSKHPEKFGTGCVEGVIAPESANNAVTSGALLTTLALGIPGSATMALALGAFLMLGLIPGPEMMTKHLDLALTLQLVVMVSNVIAAAICFATASQLAKVAWIPSRILVPLILVIALVGVYAYREMFNDLIVAIVFGGLGLAMRRFGYNRPGFFLGFILGVLFEKYFFIALRVAGPLFFVRPISLTLIFIIIALFVYKPLKGLFQRRRGVQRA